MKISILVISSLLAGLSGGYIIGANYGIKDNLSSVPPSSELLQPSAATSKQSFPVHDKSHKQGETDHKLTALKGQLDNANNEIDRLQGINYALKQQIENMNLPMSDSITYPEVLNKIDKLPPAFIKDQLSRLFRQEYVDQIENPAEFSKKLVDIALDNQPVEDGEKAAYISFSSSPVSGADLLGEKFPIKQFETIFAHVNTSENLEDIIIKWQNLSTTEILYFKNQSYRANGTHQYIGLRPDAGWTPGHYMVTIYDVTGEAKPVGANTYFITSVVPEEENSPGMEQKIMNELIMSGQAIPRQK